MEAGVSYDTPWKLTGFLEAGSIQAEVDVEHPPTDLSDLEDAGGEAAHRVDKA